MSVELITRKPSYCELLLDRIPGKYFLIQFFLKEVPQIYFDFYERNFPGYFQFEHTLKSIVHDGVYVKFQENNATNSHIKEIIYYARVLTGEVPQLKSEKNPLASLQYYLQEECRFILNSFKRKKVTV